MSSVAARLFPLTFENRLQCAGFLVLAGSISLVLVSIAVSQILLGGALVAALLQWKKERVVPHLPGTILWPALLLFLWSLIAAFASAGGIRDAFVKKFFLFSLLLIVPVLARGGKKTTWIYHAVFAVSAVSAAAGLAQFLINPHRDALHRIQGFMSIWMTYSGLLMLVLVALAAYAMTGSWRRHLWTIPIGLAVAAALYLSETRSAELGAVAGTTVVLLLLKRRRAILGILVLLPVLYLASPQSIRQRLRGGFDPNDANTKNRIELIGTAWRLIQDHPWLGVGQKVSREALNYRGTLEFPDYMYIHMHNDFLQIGAERGIPGLVIWLWFMFQSGWQAFRILRAAAGAGRIPPDGTVTFAGAAAIGGWVALLSAGLFEYNFGDSEVLTLFLFMMSAPHAAQTGSTE